MHAKKKKIDLLGKMSHHSKLNKAVTFSWFKSANFSWGCCGSVIVLGTMLGVKIYDGNLKLHFFFKDVIHATMREQ